MQMESIGSYNQQLNPFAYTPDELDDNDEGIEPTPNESAYFGGTS